MSLQKAIETLEKGLKEDVLSEYELGRVSISFMTGYAHAIMLV